MSVVAAGPVALRVRPRAVAVCAALAAVLVALGLYALTLGEFRLGAGEIARYLAGGGDTPIVRYFVVDVRAPRVVAAALVGAALGVSGALSQTVTGNPLGSPDVLGFSTGAATGALVAIVGLHGGYGWAGPGSVVGAVLTLVAVLALAWRREDGLPMPRLVLVGVGIGAGLAGLNRYVISRASLADGLAASVWDAGSFESLLWPRLVWPAIALGVLAAATVPLARSLDVVVLGDDPARALGVDPTRVRVGAIVLSVLLVAVATSVAGPMAFVALAAPHAVRLATGGERPGLVASALAGAVTVEGADVLGRTLAPGHPLPAGLVTGVVGGVYLVALLARSWRRGQL